MSQQQATPSSLADYTKLWLSKYDSIRGKTRAEFPFKFWDVVVITTADKDQREAYDLQLSEKLARKELPEDVDYHIIADIPGPKLGNGGSTFTALARLEEMYGNSLFNKRVLLLHAGGQSQRMPSASLLGKVFTALPFGSPMYQMLDLKLANTITFLENMSPGILLLCADDIQIFDMSGEEGKVRMDQEGFTALAHPSSPQTGTGHGVYVIEGGSLVRNQLVQMSRCLEVLQKPTFDRMEKRGAHLSCVTSSSNGDTAVTDNSEPLVYTDSLFYFDSKVCEKLIKFYHENKPLTCEIDAYGDFLQCLGSQSSIDYVNLTGNVSKITPTLIPMRKKVYHLLKDTPIHILALNHSKYVHIGTTKELLFHFCEDPALRQELNISSDVFNRWVNLPSKDCGGKIRRCEPTVNGCVMHSSLPSTSSIAARCVVEFSWFDVPLIVGPNSIISNCCFSHKESSLSEVNLPGDIFLHTAAVKGENSTGYVTIVFDIYENLKKKAGTKEEIAQLQYMKTTLEKAAVKLNLELMDMFSNEEQCYNLWSARLFPITGSMTDSLTIAVDTVKALRDEEHSGINLSKYKLTSMQDVLNDKNVKDMLAYRRNLYSTIKMEHTE